MRSFLTLFIVSLALLQQLSSSSAHFDLDQGTAGSGKESWPDVVGEPGEQAQAEIEADTGGSVKVFVLPWDAIVTEDYRLDRVRIFVDDNGNVSKPPRIG
jgi:hypothetical protein